MIPVADDFGFIANRANELRAEAEREAKARAKITSTHCGACGTSGWVSGGYSLPAIVCATCGNPDAKPSP